MAPSKTQPRAQAPADEWGDEIGGGTLVKWNEPKVIIGIYETREMVQGQYGLKPRATIVTSDGETLAFFPPAMLDSRLQQVSFGQKVRIEYDGTSSPSKSGQPVKNFSVRVSANGLHTEAFAGEIPT